MSNAAIDHERREALNEARRQPEKLSSPGKFNVPKNGSADSRLQNSQAGNDGEQKNYSERLSMARAGNLAGRAVSAYNNISNPLGAITDKGLDVADKKFGQDSFKSGPFVAAGMAAILKDMMDLGFVASLPVVGTVITLCASIFIGFMLILAGSYKKKGAATQMIKKFLVLFMGTLTEMIFGLNFVPMETITVAIIYWMTKKEEKQKDESKKEGGDTDASNTDTGK